jgi:hypothetical protein
MAVRLQIGREAEKKVAMKMFRNQNGQALIFTALSMSMLLGFMGLAIDVGLLFRAKRNLQVAADAAATAGALDLSRGLSASNAANLSLTSDLEVGSSPVAIAESDPPADGPNKGTKGFVEVVLSQPNPTAFMGMFSFHSVSVSARAVAGVPTFSDNCIWLMNKNKKGALSMQGGANSQLNATGCSVYINSSNAGDALDLTGNPTIYVDSINIVGGANKTSNNMHGTVNSGVSPETPILPTDTTGPTPASGCSGNTDTTSTSINSTYTPAGSVVCFSNAINLSDGAYLKGAASGVIYVFENGLTIANGATVNVGSATCKSGTGGACTSTSTGNTFSNTQGATLDIQGGAFNIASGQANLSVYAPTAGTYNGIGLMQPIANSTSSSGCSPSPCMLLQFGSSGTFFDGMIFAPGLSIDMHDAAAGVTATGVIADSMNIKSSQMNIPSYSAANAATTPLREVALVE